MRNRKRTISRRNRFVLVALYFIIVLSITIGLWLPEFKHNHIAGIEISDETISKARYLPPDSIINELCRDGFIGSPRSHELIAQAEKILSGKYRSRGDKTELDFSFPFDPQDLDHGSAAQKLALASLHHVNVLLEAYYLGRREKYFEAARDILVAFARYEEKAFLTKGLLRNDHATAIRGSVVIKFWNVYRNHDSFENETARTVLRQAARIAAYLSKNSHFMYASNHGIMQNIALMQLALAFPDICSTERAKSLTLQRLRDQLQYYINEEGVVLEHSAGYQTRGTHSLKLILEYCRMLNLEIPDGWQAKYDRARTIYASLLRPDTTLPIFGDTRAGAISRLPPPINLRKTDEKSSSPAEYDFIGSCRTMSLLPVAGWAIRWDGLTAQPETAKLTQTAVTWSYFPGHAHKLSDEMSLNIWSGRYDWWGGTGYWQYNTTGRILAESWLGSNAPHLVRENTLDPNTGSFFSNRETFLTAYASTEDILFLDLERTGPGEIKIRRQIFDYNGRRWLVIDSHQGNAAGDLEVAWTADRRVRTLKGDWPGSYRLYPPDTDTSQYMRSFFLGSDELEIDEFRGSTDPWLGWQSVDFDPRPTTTIIVRQPADDDWLAAVFSLRDQETDNSGDSRFPEMTAWNNIDNWSFHIPGQKDSLIIERNHDSISVRQGDRETSVTLIPLSVADTKAKRSEIASAYDAAAAKYKFFRSAIRTRWKITRFLLIILVVQEIFFFLWQRYARLFYNLLRGINITCWIVGGIWLLTIYRIY